MNVNKTVLWSLIFSVLCLLAAVATFLTGSVFSSLLFFNCFIILAVYAIYRANIKEMP